VFGLSRGDGVEDVPARLRLQCSARPAAKPKLDPLIGVIDAILEADCAAPVKQRHTAKRFRAPARRTRLLRRRLYGGEGLRAASEGARPVRSFKAAVAPAGQYAQVDFWRSMAVIGGVRQKHPLLQAGPAAVGQRLCGRPIPARRP
jgi:hypothetical protein